MAVEPDPNLTLVEHNAQRFRRDDVDHEEYPFCFKWTGRPPSLPGIAWAFEVGGDEVLVVRSKTLESLQGFVEVNGLRDHLRVKRFTITGPEGQIEHFDRYAS